MKNQFLNKNYILTASLSAAVYVASNMVITTLPRHLVKIGQSKLMVGTLMLVFTLSACVTRLMWGKMADKWGRIVVIYIGIGLTIASVILMFFKGEIAVLLLSRGVFGAGFSAVITAAATLSTEVVQAKYISKAVAIYGLGGVLTQAIAPPLALYLYSYGLAAVAIAAIFLLVVSAVLTFGIKLEYCKGEKLDSNKMEYNTNKIANKKCRQAVFERSALSPSIIAGIVTFSTAGIFSFVPILTGKENIENVSGFFLANSIGLLFSRLVFAKISQKISHSRLFYIGIAIFVTGFLVLSFAKNNISLVIAGLFYGYGLGSVHPILNTQAISKAKKQARAGAMAVFYAFQDMGVAIGSVACGFLADAFTLKAVFLICAAVAAFSALPFFLFNSKKQY